MKTEYNADAMFSKKNNCVFPIWSNSCKLRGGEEIEGIGIKNGLTLF